MEPHYLGIEIGGTKLQVVLGTQNAVVTQRWRYTVDRAKGAGGIRSQLREALPAIAKQHRVAGVGVGFGGPVDWRMGRIAKSHQIEGWSGFDLAGWIRGLVEAPVYIDNDANVATLGEAHHGAGCGLNPVFYVTLGSGVGGGLVWNGRIYHGATPGESEIGHLRLDRQGTIVESRCSGWAVDAKIREHCRRSPETILSRLVGESSGGEAKHLVAAIRHGDPSAQAILAETAADLAFALSHVAHLFHPEIVILGGGLSLIGEPLRAAVEKALKPFLMEVFLPGPRLALAQLGEDAVPVGALRLAADAANHPPESASL